MKNVPYENIETKEKLVKNKAMVKMSMPYPSSCQTHSPKVWSVKKCMWLRKGKQFHVKWNKIEKDIKEHYNI